MDQERFDDVARGLAPGISRRGIMRTLTGAAVGGMLAAVGASQAGARNKKKNRSSGKRKGQGRSQARKQSAAAGKVAVCHYDADAETWELITVSQRGWDNGHAKHEQDYLLNGECCTDVDCSGDESCHDGACAVQCTRCGDGCAGAAETNPTKTLSFTPAGSDYCSVIVNLTGFAGCTEYTAEYWSAANPAGYRPVYYGNVTLGPTDMSGSSQTNLGSFAKGGYLDIRFVGDAPDFQWPVDC